MENAEAKGERRTEKIHQKDNHRDAKAAEKCRGRRVLSSCPEGLPQKNTKTTKREF